MVSWLSGGSKVTSGLRRFPLGALRFGLSSFRLPGAFRRTADDSGSGGARGIWLRVDTRILVVGAVQLVVLLTAQLTCGGPRAQRPLLVSLAEGVGAELAEGLGVFPADVTVVPGAIPAACRRRNDEDINDTADLRSEIHTLDAETKPSRPSCRTPLCGISGASYRRVSW